MAAFKQFDTSAFFQNLGTTSAATAASAANIPSEPKYAADAASAAGVSGENEKEWDNRDWQSFYDERADFLEYECNLTRKKAERQAYEATIVQWLNVTSPQNLDNNHCAQCGNLVGRIGQDAVPFLTGGDGHAWLHHDCHPAWLTRRRQAAVEALQAVGLSHYKLRKGYNNEHSR